MEKRNRILLLMDFSEHSESLTTFAFEFAEIIQAGVIFIHQVSGLAPAMADQTVRREVVRSETDEAHSALRKLAKGRVYSQDSFQVSHLPILSIIKSLESEAFIDWVIVGLKGTGPLKRLFLGSKTLSIIDESQYLTVAVPAREAVPMPEKLLVGVSPKFPLNKVHFKIVLSALKDQIRHLEFFNILKEEEEEDLAQDYLQAFKKEYEAHNPIVRLYKGEDALVFLKNRVELSQKSFLVLQQGSRTINDRLFRKFMINELVYRGQMPLIVLSR